ncbi:MAG: hypothetical protein IKP54_03645 [Bacteroidales bacterium]|nr:hypothetical protein [Bacteroidales bacterium]
MVNFLVYNRLRVVARFIVSRRFRCVFQCKGTLRREEDTERSFAPTLRFAYVGLMRCDLFEVVAADLGNPTVSCPMISAFVPSTPLSPRAGY